MHIAVSDNLLTRFLLGEIDERERAEVEDRLLSDEEFYEQMLSAESDLMDAYVRGELSAQQRERFERIFFTSPRLSERVEFARGLAESATRLHQDSARPGADVQPASPSRPRGFLTSLLAQRQALTFAITTASVAIVAGAIWLVVERMRGPVEPQQARTEGVAPERPVERPQDSPNNDSEAGSRKQDERPSQVAANATPSAVRTPERDPIRSGQPPSSPSVFATFMLAPGSLRDGTGGGDILIPPETTHVRLSLQLENDNYQRYRAVVRTPEGRNVWSGPVRKDRATNADSVTITLPAGALERGDYVVELSGASSGGEFEPAAQYSFRVIQNHLR